MRKRYLTQARYDGLLIVLVALGLFLVFLGSYPLILPDEGRYSDIVRHMVNTGQHLVPIYDGIPFFDKPT